MVRGLTPTARATSSRRRKLSVMATPCKYTNGGERSTQTVSTVSRDDVLQVISHRTSSVLRSEIGSPWRPTGQLQGFRTNAPATGQHVVPSLLRPRPASCLYRRDRGPSVTARDLLSPWPSPLNLLQRSYLW
jgi:hypothetical protein